MEVLSKVLLRDGEDDDGGGDEDLESILGRQRDGLRDIFHRTVVTDQDGFRRVLGSQLRLESEVRRLTKRVKEGEVEVTGMERACRERLLKGLDEYKRLQERATSSAVTVEKLRYAIQLDRMVQEAQARWNERKQTTATNDMLNGVDDYILKAPHDLRRSHFIAEATKRSRSLRSVIQDDAKEVLDRSFVVMGNGDGCLATTSSEMYARLEESIALFRQVGTLREHMEKLRVDFTRAVLLPLAALNYTQVEVHQRDKNKVLTGRVSVASDKNILEYGRVWDDLTTCLDFFFTAMDSWDPDSRPLLARRMASDLIPYLLEHLLQANCPATLDSLASFDAALAQAATRFERQLEQRGMLHLLGEHKDDEENQGPERSLAAWSAHLHVHFAGKVQSRILGGVRQMLLSHTPPLGQYGVETEQLEEVTVIPAQTIEVPGKRNGAATAEEDIKLAPAWDVELELPQAPPTLATPKEKSSKTPRKSSRFAAKDKDNTTTGSTHPAAAAVDEGHGTNGDAPEKWGWDTDNWGIEDIKTPSSVMPSNELQQASELRQHYTVSRHAQRFMDEIRAIVLEVQNLAESSSKTARQSGPYVLRAIPDALALFRALVPFHYSRQLTAVPALSMQFSNDCTYLFKQLTILADSKTEQHLIESEEIEQFRILGQRWYREELNRQQDAIQELLQEAQDLQNTSNEPVFQKAQAALTKVVDLFNRLSRSWRPILTSLTYDQAMGLLVDFAMSWVIECIEGIEDISAEESERLAQLCKVFQPLDEIFMNSSETSSTIVVHVPHYLKYCYLREMLTASMADIIYLFEQRALIDFKTTELERLVVALFAESDLREKNLARIRQGHPS